MKLDEAILHAEEVAKNRCDKCGAEHKQLAEWLKDYKRLLEQEPILDKIRAEIEKVVWEDVIVSLDGTDEVRIPCLDPDDVFDILDKYKENNNETYN